MPAWLQSVMAWPHLSNALGFAGMILLAWPALYAARQAKRLHDFARREPGQKVHKVFRWGYRRTRQRLRERGQAWTAFHGFCLYVGYGLVTLSYLASFLPPQ